jgi:hypothetical protein
MYENQEQLNMMAQAAKQQLSQQVGGNVQTGNNEDIYAGLGLDSEMPGPAPTQTYQEPIFPQNIPEEDDSDIVMRNIDNPSPELDPYDDELFPGGPTKSQINLWKKEWDGYDIYVTEILKETFIFRTLNRYEYKQLVSFIDINGLQREETICATCTLWPKNYDYKTMATTKAGIPSTYSEIIMEKSGFTKDFAIQEI